MFFYEIFHALMVPQICLGEGALEENNVVEVTAMNHQGKTTSVPIANLHINCLPMVMSNPVLLNISLQWFTQLFFHWLH